MKLSSLQEVKYNILWATVPCNNLFICSLTELFHSPLYLRLRWIFADEGPAFDALQTLADLSLMMPTDNEDGMRSRSTISCLL